LPITPDFCYVFLKALFGDDPAELVVCGFSQVPFDRMVGDVRIINVGSVGEAPDGSARSGEGAQAPHRSTIAHATWIESTPSGLVVEQIIVPLGAPAVQLASSL
jgi:hypothetical protein